MCSKKEIFFFKIIINNFKNKSKKKSKINISKVYIYNFILFKYSNKYKIEYNFWIKTNVKYEFNLINKC